jgi:hypothetical protein
MEQIMKIQSTHSRQGNLYRNNAPVFVKGSHTFPWYNEENLACLTNEVLYVFSEREKIYAG